MNVGIAVHNVEVAHEAQNKGNVAELTQQFRRDLYLECEAAGAPKTPARLKQLEAADSQWQTFEEKLSPLGYDRLPNYFRDLVGKQDPLSANVLGWA